MAESGAIFRWASKKAGLYPCCEDEMLQVEEAIALVVDIIDKFIPLYYV